MCRPKKTQLPGPVPKTKPEPSVAGPVWRGGAKERMTILKKIVGAKRTLLRHGPSIIIGLEESQSYQRFAGRQREVLSIDLTDSKILPCGGSLSFPPIET